MNESINLITLHDVDFKKEYLINAAEISSVSGHKASGRYDGAVVSMKNGDRFLCYEGTDEITKMLIMINKRGE